jgi:hypothetical protein
MGGCMFVDDVEFCQAVNLEPAFDLAAEEEAMSVPDTPSIMAQQNTTVYASDDNECVICYEEIGKTNNCVTPCGHAFCFRCLVAAMTTKNTCPCCRSELFVLPNEEEEEEDDYEESDDEESVTSNDSFVPVETLVSRLEAKGFTMLDMVSMLTNNYSKIDLKYTAQHIESMHAEFDNLLEEIENEYDEQRKFAEEDTRTRENNRV